MSFFDELKRRNVFRVGAAYAVTAWVLLQVLDVVGEILDLPVWGGKLILTLLVIGFFLALILAWAYELTPEGVKREKDVDRDRSVARETGRKLDRLIMIVLAIAVAYLLVDKLLLEDSNGPPTAAAPAEVARVDPSVAVLPFVNMSANEENEYFSDGLTETLLHMLAQVPELKVAARTSSFAFKDSSMDIREIADQLDVANVLEGSVQRAGTQVRITAQLIQASDGYHLWSQTFDRDLDNIFAVQDEIATQVANALSTSLLGSETVSIRPDGGTTNTEAYDLYLRAREAYHAGTERKLAEAVRLMRRAIALDPDFALAWAGLADAIRRHALLAGVNWLEFRDEYRQAAEKAVALAPENAQALSVMGEVHRAFREMGEAEELLERAITLEPSNAGAFSRLADVRFAQGRYRQAAEAATRAMSIDPLDFELKAHSTFKFLQLGQVDKARHLTDAVLQNDPDSTVGLSALGNIYWRTGQFAEAYRVYHRMLEINPNTVYLLGRMASSFMELGDLEVARQILDRMEEIDPLSVLNDRAWLCYIEGQLECARSYVRQRLDRVDGEERVRTLVILAWFDGDWAKVLEGSLHLVEYAREKDDLWAGAFLRLRAALAADRLGALERRDELLDELVEYIDSGQAQGSDSQYLYRLLADVHALRGDVTAAVADLQAAIDRGYRDELSILHDGYYDGILQEPSVIDVLARLRASNREELARVRAVVKELGPIW